MKRKAPVAVTGGGGFRYENAVAARFLLDLLAGANSLGADSGRVNRLDWQARDSGWLADDLVVSSTDPNGERCCCISIKSDQQVTRSGFPATFVEIAWTHWLGVRAQRKIREGSDAIALVTGGLAHDVQDAWSRTLAEATETSIERMTARLVPAKSDEGSQSSAIQRALVESLRCPDTLSRSDDTNDANLMRLLRHVRLLYFDYEKPTSRDHGLALADCQRVLRSGNAADAARLWDRLAGISDAKRSTGGSIDLPGLLTELRAEFDLCDHPDYRKEWDALERHSREAMADIRTEIAGLPALARESRRAEIQNHLDTRGACFLIGESGCGKSALAKQTAQTQYRRAAWITENTLDHETLLQCEQALGIDYPFVEILSALPEPCLLVFDAIEKYSSRALRSAARLIQDLHAADGARHVRLLFTAQFEAADRIIRRLVELGIPLALLEGVAVPRPTETDIQGLMADIPQIQWTSLRPELRPLLTNLKVLDWVVAAVRAGQAIDDRALIGLTTLIDVLWERWVENGDGLDRSHLLMHLGMLEAETLAVGVPRMRLAHSEQRALQALAASELVRIRDERVRFSHDLLGDWARLRVLVGEGPLSSPASRERAISPRWHRAVRLYAQRLLEQSPDGCEQWQSSIAQLDDESQAGRLLQDLFLESVFLATNAAALLERTWPALSASGGRLLNRMLNRFLFVATLPDPRLSAFLGDEMEPALWEHLARLPYWPYWAPMLTVLHAHRAEVANLAPHAAAKICSLWLRTMTNELTGGRQMPWRREAAELAVTIGREIQALNAEGNYFSNGHDKNAYEAVLWSAPELPDDVGALCLELGERRPLAPELSARVEATHRRRAEERRQWLEANPERRQAPPPVFFGRGSRHEPWPDGPRDNVQRCFQEACLDTNAFAALVDANPDVALEVLLAVCIEEPQYDDFGSRPSRGVGLDYWQAGDPPFYSRGPFLLFLRQAPEQGLSFVIRLTNFTTRRFVEVDEGQTITVNGHARNWRGDSRVFRWHHDWPLHNGSAVQSALMALERWLYEQIDQGHDIEPRVTRILAESESLAFAGLLHDVGKRSPALLAGVLRPLISNWVLCDWDLQLATLRQSEGMGYWGNQPAIIIRLAQEWFRLPHRIQPLSGIGGPVIQTMIGREQERSFFEQLRADWSNELDPQGEPNRLRLLIERFNPDNYTFEVRDGARVPVDFHWPEAIERENAESLSTLHDEMTLTSLPHRCRERLRSGAPLPADQAASFLEYLQRIAAERPEISSRHGEPLHHIEDVLCGGIAVLVVLNHAWLSADPARMAWCHETLQATVERPPAPLPFDSEVASGEHRWDAFASECGVALLAVNRDDALARRLAALGVLSYHYSTTGLTMLRACQSRDQLGDDFDRMLVLAVRWAGLRGASAFARHRRDDEQRDTWRKREAALAREFIDQRLPIAYPDMRAIDATALAEIEAIQAEQFPEQRRRRKVTGRRAGRSRQSLYPDRLGLDTHVLMSAFAWLDLAAARSAEERHKWLAFVKEFVAIVLELIPAVDDPQQEEIDGLPTDFDGWVWGLAARAIPRMTPDEDPRTLWQPVLDLGAPAHEWVERFFWYWFSDGLRVAASPDAFARLWSAMIEHALASPLWDPRINRHYDLDDMVFELLGFDSRMHTLAQNAEFVDVLGRLEPLFARAADRLFAMPKVMNGFVHFAVKPAASKLMLPGITWLAAVVPSLDSYDWKYGLEDNLIAFLHSCWERHGEEISRNSSLHVAFLTLLTAVVSRGGHAAIALRDRVVASAAA